MKTFTISTQKFFPAFAFCATFILLPALIAGPVSAGALQAGVNASGHLVESASQSKASELMDVQWRRQRPTFRGHRYQSRPPRYRDRNCRERIVRQHGRIVSRRFHCWKR